MYYRLAAILLSAASPAAAVMAQPGVLLDGAGKPIGKVTVTDAPGGVLLRIEASRLPPGWHGLHFHERGDCSDSGFKNAGTHVHRETPVVHGLLVNGANDAGDLPNLFVGTDGGATVEFYSTFVSLRDAGRRPALDDQGGAALVIHAQPDDYHSQPIGGAGDRIACAIVP